ncbi:MAG: hypothetical protein ACREUT_09350 [Steroidobacteraceae bacterium]
MIHKIKWHPCTGIAVAALACAPALAAAAVNSSQRVRAFAALPDWSGFWEWTTGVTLNRVTGEPAPEVVPQLIANAQLAGHPPYNPDWDARYQVRVKAHWVQRASGRDDPASKGCSFGFPAQMEALDETFQFLITPEETVILFERGEVRHIYTDGRHHPHGEDLWSTVEGDSIGHWDGQTLVIDTIARTAGPIGFFAPDALLSDQAHFTERIRMLDRDMLEDQMTIEDPVAFVRPWRVTIRHDRVKGLDRFIGYDCSNDRNPIVNGHLTIAPP